MLRARTVKHYKIQTQLIIVCFLWTAYILHQESLKKSRLFFSLVNTTTTTTIAIQRASANATTNGTSTSSSTIKFIKYQLVQGVEHYNYTFDPIKAVCREKGNNSSRVPLPILSEVGVTDFRTRVQTNLNILYIGDSVGMQFAQSFQDAAGAKSVQTIRYAWGPHKLSHIARVEGGGVVAGLRVTGFFLEKWKNELYRVAPSPGGGWLEYDVIEMKRLLHHWREMKVPQGFISGLMLIYLELCEGINVPNGIF
jgi:hypothetical protein